MILKVMRKIKYWNDEIEQKNFNDEIPTGVSIESASYIEKNDNNNSAELVSQDSNSIKGEIEDEYTPKLFSEEHNTLKILNKKTYQKTKIQMSYLIRI